jgi:hypothetical protein
MQHPELTDRDRVIIWRGVGTIVFVCCAIAAVVLVPVTAQIVS